MSVNKKRIYLSPPHMSGREMHYIQEAFDQNWVAPLGPNVDGFEEDLGTYTGVDHVAVLSSGTAAIHLALIILGVERGDEVIASSFTFSATVNPIIYQGATPVFVDSESDTWNMDPELLEQAIQEGIRKGKRPKAIILVHLYGMPAKMDALMAVADRYEIPIIEDAAEALGSRYRGRALGSFGKFGVFSFNGNKILNTSGGGALLSQDGELINTARFLATQARDQAPHYQHSQIGYNYRMSNILAGLGRGQMEVIEDRVRSKRENFSFYKKNLGSRDGISFLEEPDESFYSNYWLTTILVDPRKSGTTREEIQKILESENIETRPLWKPMHMQPVFSEHPAYLSGVSRELFDKGLCLPSGSSMSDEDRARVLQALLKAL